MMSDDDDLIIDGRGLRVAVSAVLVLVLVVVGGAPVFYKKLGSCCRRRPDRDRSDTGRVIRRSR